VISALAGILGITVILLLFIALGARAMLGE
jgi:hypothetical protein